MPFKEWTTTYTGETPVQDPDPITINQPDVENNPASVPREPGTGDNTRVSHPMTLRDKLQTLAKLVGDSNNDPPGSLMAKMATAIRTDSAGDIHGITNKDIPVDADEIVIEDSADSWAKKRVALSALGGGGGAPGSQIWDVVLTVLNAYDTSLGELVLVQAPQLEPRLLLSNAEDNLLWNLDTGSWVAKSELPTLPDPGMTGGYALVPLSDFAVALCVGDISFSAAAAAVMLFNGGRWTQLGTTLAAGGFPIDCSGSESFLYVIRRSGGTIDVSGDGDSISAPVMDEQTLTDADASFDAGMIGAVIDISDTTEPGNNGQFVITDVPSGNSVKYMNPDGAVETSAFTWRILTASESQWVYWDGDAWTTGMLESDVQYRAVHFRAADDVWIIMQSMNDPNTGFIYHRITEEDILGAWVDMFPVIVGGLVEGYGAPLSLFGRGRFIYIGTSTGHLLIWDGIAGHVVDLTALGPIIGIWGSQTATGPLWVAAGDGIYECDMTDVIDPVYGPPAHTFWGDAADIRPDISGRAMAGTEDGQNIILTFRSAATGVSQQVWTEDGGSSWSSGTLPNDPTDQFGGVGSESPLDCIVTLPSVTGTDEGKMVAVKNLGRNVGIVAQDGATIDGGSISIIEVLNQTRAFCVDEDGNWQHEADYANIDLSELLEMLAQKDCKWQPVVVTGVTEYTASPCELVNMVGLAGGGPGPGPI